jgi:hypothetical protein
VNKCDWIAQFALFSQFVTCLGRIVHHSPRSNFATAIVLSDTVRTFF